ncbi:MAG: DUF1643 domain-containing protein [Pseudomonadota bacterium]
MAERIKKHAELGQLSLLGEPSLKRSAVFSGDMRLELNREWAPGPKACVIGHNPSDAGADREDSTSLWWNRWFMHHGFGSYTAVNAYPWISSKPVDVYERLRQIEQGVDWGARDDLYITNYNTVARVAKAADQVFVCWGSIARDDAWISQLIEGIQGEDPPWPNLWCWGFTKSGAPTHPMARGKHRIDPLQKPLLWRAA